VAGTTRVSSNSYVSGTPRGALSTRLGCTARETPKRCGRETRDARARECWLHISAAWLACACA
jgi:hypothetical protein